MRLLLAVFILVIALPLYAQKPVVKFYLNDGSQAKEYKIEDINQINFIKSNPNTSIFIFQKDTTRSFMIANLVSIEFSDSNKLKINLPYTSKILFIATIDSIIFIDYSCSDVTIGTQTWMCRNLDVDHYRNGDSIPQVTDKTVWKNLTTGAWCYYNNDPKNGAIYGKLYNWYAVNDPRGLAPEGWYIPSFEEYEELANSLGGLELAGGKMKSTSTIDAGDGLWRSPNIGATNETGFSAHPAGFRADEGTFGWIGHFGYWWNSTEHDKFTANLRGLSYNFSVLYLGKWNKQCGLSVRCIKD